MEFLMKLEKIKNEIIRLAMKNGFSEQKANTYADKSIKKQTYLYKVLLTGE